MIKCDINPDLKQRIRSYIWKEEKEMDDQEINKIIEKLSKTL